MNNGEPKDEWIHLEDDDPPPDLSREDAAFERELPRLLREHRGKIAVARFDEIVGVYDNLDEATIDAHRRFGWKRMVFYLIEERDDEPEYIANVDTSHPSFGRIDKNP